MKVLVKAGPGCAGTAAGFIFDWILALPLAFGLAAVPAGALGECPAPEPRPESEIDAEYNQLLDEIQAMAALQELDFQIGGQRLFRVRTRADAFSGRDRIAERLRALKPRLEALFAEVGAPATRPVLLIESLSDTFSGAAALTTCAEVGREHSVMDALEEGTPLPPGACLIVIYPDRVSSTDYLDFALAHEWMHTQQSDAYVEAFDNTAWWTEGSADWFGHKIMAGFTERDDVIAEFFDKQRNCPLNDTSYPSQVFFFWGEQEFDAPWVFEHGLFGEDGLRETSQAALLLPPERWLDWAKAQADEAITLPDGRALPSSALAEPIDFSVTCEAIIEGPPLSVQLRKTEFLTDADGPLRIDHRGGQVALRQADGTWTDLSGGVLDPIPMGPLTIAAIQPDASPLSVTLSLDGCEARCDEVPRQRDACLIGTWEQTNLRELEPTSVTGPAGSATTLAAPRPAIWIFFPDGRLIEDTPLATQVDSVLDGTRIRTTTRLDIAQSIGVWGTGGRRLELCHTREIAQGRLTVEADSGGIIRDEPIVVDADLEDARSRTLRYTCEGDRLTARGGWLSFENLEFRRVGEAESPPTLE